MFLLQLPWRVILLLPSPCRLSDLSIRIFPRIKWSFCSALNLPIANSKLVRLPPARGALVLFVEKRLPAALLLLEVQFWCNVATDAIVLKAGGASQWVIEL